MAGFDCSGLAVELCKIGGALPRSADLSSRGLFQHFKDQGCEVDYPYAGCLVFFSSPGEPSRINHVEICLDDTYTIGASGGGDKTVTVEDAIQINAFVKVRPIKRDRPIVGYVDPFVGKLLV